MTGTSRVTGRRSLEVRLIQSRDLRLRGAR